MDALTHEPDHALASTARSTMDSPRSWSFRRIFFAVIGALLAAPGGVHAQRLANLTPVGAQHAAVAGPPRTALALRRPVLSLAPATRAADARPRRLWPWFTLGGAVLGGAGVVAYAVKHCDQGCRDDGALAFLPPYVAAGAVAGAVVGTLVGATVDVERRRR